METYISKSLIFLSMKQGAGGFNNHSHSIRPARSSPVGLWYTRKPNDRIMTDKYYGILAIENNGVGTISAINPAASPDAGAGCGFDLEALSLKSTASAAQRADIKGFSSKEDLIREYYRKYLQYSW